MKKIALMSVFALLFIFTGAQVTNKGTGRTTNLTRLKNGKYIYSSAFCRDTSGMIIIKSPEKSTPGRIAGKSPGTPNRSVQTHHIVFHFNIQPMFVMCNGTDTLFNSNWNMTWTSNLTLEADITDGYYDIITQFVLGYYERAYVFQKNFHVYKNMDTTILSTSSNHKVVMEILDESGSVILNQMLPGDNSGITFEFPADRNMPYWSEIFLGFPDTVLFSDVTPDIKISFGKAAVIKDIDTRDHLYHRYATSYPTMTGITGNMTLENIPSDYQVHTAVFQSSPGLKNPYLSFGFGFIINQALSAHDYFAFGFGNGEYPSHATDTCILYASNRAIDTNIVFFVSGVGHWEDNPAYPNTSPWDFTYSWASYLNNSNELVLSANGNYPTVPADYIVPSGRQINFGNTAPFNYSMEMNTSTGYQIELYYTTFTGQSNEARLVDYSKVTYDIWKGNQHLYHDSIRGPSLFYGATSPGIYSIILNDSNYCILGTPGYMKTDLTFDLSGQDANPPTITSLKILKADEVSPEIVHDCSASVMVTAGDFEIPYYGAPIYHSIKETALYYKESGDTAWYGLTVISHPAMFDSINGMLYTADLEPVLNHFADSAWVDLKIVLTDFTDNTMTQTMHPTFLVRDMMTGIMPLASDRPILIYPDPATEKIHFDGVNEPFSIVIYTSSGQQMMQINNKREIDVSGLEPGLYLVRIKNIKTGELSFGKFIK